jgi:hypothetical protein
VEFRILGPLEVEVEGGAMACSLDEANPVYRSFS